MGELDGQVAIVTGAGRMRGTGHSIATVLAAHGADIVVHGSGSGPESWPQSERDAGWNGLESVAEEVRALGRRALVTPADLRNSAEVDAMVASAVAEFGRVDILVNNAAAPKGADRVPVVEMTDDTWSQVLGVKLDGSFYCARAVARQLIKQNTGGRIINISSVAAKIAKLNISAYSVANAGLQMLGANLSKELGPYGVTVNSLALGPIVSSRIDDLGDGEEFAAYIASIIPLNRAGTPDEVGEIIAFLCSRNASYISGQTFNIDGAWDAH